MRRTQIYITDQQERRLAERARDEGVSKAEVIRRILDRAFGGDGGEAEALAVIRATAGICADYPDWQEWQRQVRGRSADARLGDAGL
jgi:hypothetical protein